MKGRRRVESETRLAAVVADEAERAVDMLGGLRMKRDYRGARLCEYRDERVDRLHHEMHVNRLGDIGSDRLADERANREVRDIVIVHYVEMDEVGARLQHVCDLLAQPSEIGGENAGGDAVRAQGHVSPRGQVRPAAGGAVEWLRIV